MTQHSPTQSLADFAANLSWAALPAAVQHAARRNLLNVLGCGLGGQADPAIQAFSLALRPLAGTPTATEIGIGLTDASTAAFLNAAAANVHDFDDQHLPTVMHPGPLAVAAALAAAEMVGADGQTLLTAIIAGLEGGCRIGQAVTPGHYAAGFHITTTCGVFAAALAAGRVLGLDAPAMGWAIGHAAGQSAGLIEALGADSKSTAVGAAARAGLQAALFARAGIAGPASPLEGRFGFLAVMAPDAAAGRITEGLGLTWEALRNAPKAYPVGVVLHPVVDACLMLAASAGFDPSRLESLEIIGHPLLRLRTNRPAPANLREAPVSAQHVAAMALLRGQVSPAELTATALADPAGLALRGRIFLSEQPEMAVESARLVARDTAGRQWDIHVPMGRGLPDRPLTDAELEAKASGLIGSGAAWCNATALLALCWRAEQLATLAPLTALLHPPASGG